MLYFIDQCSAYLHVYKSATPSDKIVGTLISYERKYNMSVVGWGNAVEKWLAVPPFLSRDSYYMKHVFGAHQALNAP